MTPLPHPKFLPHLTKSIGIGNGIDFRKLGLSLNARNDKVVEARMASKVTQTLRIRSCRQFPCNMEPPK